MLMRKKLQIFNHRVQNQIEYVQIVVNYHTKHQVFKDTIGEIQILFITISDSFESISYNLSFEQISTQESKYQIV